MSLSVLLICAVLASLALGVLLAYGVCLSMFHLFRIHARQVANRNAAPLAVGSARAMGN